MSATKHNIKNKGKQSRETRSKNALKIPMRQYQIVTLRLEGKVQFDYNAHGNVNLL